MTRPGARQAEALMKRFGLVEANLLGMRFAINVAVATTIVWYTLRVIGDSNPIWAIASMIAASDPQPDEARRMFKCRLVNVAVGSATGFVFLVVGGTQEWLLPLALAAAVVVSTYVVRVKTMWRQAPITAAVVIAAAAANDSFAVGIEHGLHKVAEVVFGCLVGVAVSMAMSRVWLIRSPIEETIGPRPLPPTP
jgi:uncharacterized membrane protein YccC